MPQDGVAGDGAARTEGAEGEVDADIEQVQRLVGDDKDEQAARALRPVLEMVVAALTGGRDRLVERGACGKAAVALADIGEDGGGEGAEVGQGGEVVGTHVPDPAGAGAGELVAPGRGIAEQDR